MAARSRVRSAFSILRRYGSTHRRILLSGLAATSLWVLCRLAMPWPLRGVIDLANERGVDAALASFLPGPPLLQLCLAYLAIIVGLGCAELLQRTAFSRFAAATVDGMRAAALQGSRRQRARGQTWIAGDLIARLIGDTARLKSDINGFLVHACQNALLFLAIVALLLAMSPMMALFFLLGGVVTVAIGCVAARPVARLAHKNRAAEGQVAAMMQEAIEQGVSLAGLAGDGTETREARTTRTMAVASLATHLVLAATLCVALWIGLGEVRTGRLAPGELFVFIAYALTVHRRLVQLGRQLARTGKVEACVHRIAALIERDDAGVAGAGRTALRIGLRADKLRVSSGNGHGDKPRIRELDLFIPAGSRVAVLGGPGDGKSSLLRALAGAEPPCSGAIFWDDVALAEALPDGVAFLAQDPVLPRQRVGQLLGLASPGDCDRDVIDTLARLGAWSRIERLPRGLEHKVSSATLSKNETRALRLGAIVLASAPLWILDAPLDGLRKKAALARLDAILDRAGPRTVVVGMARLYQPERFTRVIELHRGKVRFDGSPDQFTAADAALPQVVSCRV